MKIVKATTYIEWLVALRKLSPGAYYLLNVLYRANIDINDTDLMEFTGYGESTHRKYKKELMTTGYLKMEQIGRGLYKYSIKDSNVK